MRDRVGKVFSDQRVQKAFRFISEHEEQIRRDQIRFTQIPAPPFEETQRARAFSEELARLGFRPSTDAIGNVIADYDGSKRNPVVVAAHLDTVFPASTPLELKQMGRTLFLPGISDNSAGVVALLWAFRAAMETGMRFLRSVIAVGSVGEEGEGNLRGVRHLFKAPPWGSRECDFVAVDGAGLRRVINHALGSRRFRLRMTGPGGHSWADFGRPNPVHALAAAIHVFCTTGASRRAGGSFNFGVISGGISVNAIPRDAMVEVDLRSTDASRVDELENQLRHCAGDAARSAGVEFSIEAMGERPSGTTAPGLPIVQGALEVTRQFGIEPQLDVGSTDANLPIAMGIPAIAVGAGGSAGNVHTPEEWFDPARRELGLQRLLSLIAVLAGLE